MRTSQVGAIYEHTFRALSRQLSIADLKRAAPKPNDQMSIERLDPLKINWAVFEAIPAMSAILSEVRLAIGKAEVAWPDNGTPPRARDLRIRTVPMNTRSNHVPPKTSVKAFRPPARLSKDFDSLPEPTEASIRIAMIQLMVRRIAAKI